MNSSPRELPDRVAEQLLVLLDGRPEDFASAVAALCAAHPTFAVAIRAEAASLWDAGQTAPGRAHPSSVAVPLPARIGPFRVLAEIGHGGMGTVYLAERPDLRQRVALKVIRLGMDTEAVLTRFEAERAALARMEHSHIAKVLDAGATERGQPWFAMEYVKGEPITRYCDKHRLSVEERLRLFQQVCSGVQHAHTKGVIHRDLTPNNILVTAQEGQATAKIIDFGLAKATDRQLTERTLFTEQGLILGTPEYMAPEQAGVGALDVDTRADVYTLGVLLYELLVGALPFSRDELRTAGWDAMCRKIQETDPPRPSTRITQAPVAQTVVQARRTDVTTLRRRMRGDLDWVVMKCLEKDRTRRYETASELAADLQRHLEHEPVMAHAPTFGYRVQKLARRYRGQLLTLTAVFVALVLGLGMATRFWLDARTQAALADEERREAMRQRTLFAQERDVAQAQRVVADLAREDAMTQRQNADRASVLAEAGRVRAEGLAYSANLMAVDHGLRAGEVAEARRRLWLCPPERRGWEWRHLLRTLDPSLATLHHPSVWINDVVWSSDGQSVVTCSNGSLNISAGHVRVWSADGGRVQTILHVPAQVQCLARFESLVAAGSEDGSIRLWDLSRGTSPAIHTGHLEAVHALAFNPDGTMLASASLDSTVRCWDVATGNVLRVFRTHDSTASRAAMDERRGAYRAIGARGLAFSADGELLAFGGGGSIVHAPGGLRVWRMRSGQVLLSRAESTPSLVFDRRAARLTFLLGTRLETWDPEQGVVVSERELGSGVTCLEFSPDGGSLATGSEDGNVRVWSAESGAATLTLPGHEGPVRGVAFAPDGGRLASISVDRTAKIWDTRSSGAARSMKGPIVRAERVAFSPDGHRLAAAGATGVQIWDASNGRHVGHLRRESDGRSHRLSAWDRAAVAFSADGRQLIASSHDYFRAWAADSLLELGDLGSSRLVTSMSLGTSTAHATAFAISSDSQRVVHVSHKDWEIWDLAGKRAIVSKRQAIRGLDDAQSSAEAPLGDGVSLAWSPRGDLIAGGTWHGEVVLRRAEDLEIVRSVVGHEDPVSDVEFSADGRWLASGSWDGLVKLWRVDGLAAERTMHGSQTAVQDVAFSPDGLRVASAAGVGAVRVWDTKSGEPLLVLRDLPAPAVGLAYRPDGNAIAVAGSFGVKVFLGEPDPSAVPPDELRAAKEAADEALDQEWLLERAIDRLNASGPASDMSLRLARAFGTRHHEGWHRLRETLFSDTRVEQSTADAAQARSLVSLVPGCRPYACLLGILELRAGNLATARQILEGSGVEEWRRPDGMRFAPLATLAIARARTGALAGAADAADQARIAYDAFTLVDTNRSRERWTWCTDTLRDAEQVVFGADAREAEQRVDELAATLSPADVVERLAASQDAATPSGVAALRLARLRASRAWLLGTAWYCWSMTEQREVWRTCVRRAEAVADRDPEDGWAAVVLGAAELRLGEYAASAAALRRALAKVSAPRELACALALLGMAERHLEPTDSRDERAAELHRLVDDHPELLSDDELAQLLSESERIVGAPVGDGDALWKRVQETSARDDFQAAQAACLEFIRVRPDDVQGWLELAGLRARQAMAGAALLALHEAELRSPPAADAPRVALLRAQCLAGLDQGVDARLAYQGAIRLAPKDASIHREFGEFLAKHGRYAEAISLIETALELGLTEAQRGGLRATPQNLELFRDVQRSAKLPAVVVSGVVPGSRAAGLGWQPGDIVRQVDGVEIHDDATFSTVWRAVAADRTAAIELQRDGTTMRHVVEGGRLGIYLWTVVADRL